MAREHHIVIYNNKAVEMSYIPAQRQFKMAAMRIIDNFAEYGYIFTPDNKVFKVTQGSKTAKAITDNKETILALELLDKTLKQVA